MRYSTYAAINSALVALNVGWYAAYGHPVNAAAASLLGLYLLLEALRGSRT